MSRQNQCLQRRKNVRIRKSRIKKQDKMQSESQQKGQKSGPWSKSQHDIYKQMIQMGMKFSVIAQTLGTRNSKQVKSHHQKFEKKMIKQGEKKTQNDIKELTKKTTTKVRLTRHLQENMQPGFQKLLHQKILQMIGMPPKDRTIPISSQEKSQKLSQTKKELFMQSQFKSPNPLENIGPTLCWENYVTHLRMIEQWLRINEQWYAQYSAQRASFYYNLFSSLPYSLQFNRQYVCQVKNESEIKVEHLEAKKEDLTSYMIIFIKEQLVDDEKDQAAEIVQTMDYIKTQNQ